MERIKPFLKHIGVIVSFLVLTFFVFKPLFEGKRVRQHDIKQYMGATKDIVDHREKYGEETLWTNSMFGGMPGYLINTRYPNSWVGSIAKTMSFGYPRVASIILLGLISAYICLLTFDIKWYWSVFGSISYAFSSFNFISLSAGHNTKVMAIALIPLMIAGLRMVFRKNYTLGGALFALGVALQINAGHYQITYYSIFILVGLGISECVRLIKSKEFKTIGLSVCILLGTAVVGVLPNTSRLLVVQEYGQYSTRGKSELVQKKADAEEGLTRDYVFAWSQGVTENMTFLVPGMFGGASTGGVGSNDNVKEFFKGRGVKERDINAQLRGIPFYWGDQSFVAGPIYIGAIGVFLFIVGLGVFKMKEYAWLLGVGLFGVFMSMGDNFASFNFFLYDHLPMFNKFRTVSMAVVIPQVVISLGAAITINRVFKEGFEVTKGVKIAVAAVVGLLLVFVVGASFFDVTGGNDERLSQYPELLDAIRQDRISFIRQDSLRSLIFIGCLIGLYFLAKAKILKPVYVGLIASVLILADLGMVNLRYFNSENYESDRKSRIRPSQADKYILSQDGEFRVYNISRSPFNESETSYFHHSIGGYHGAKIKRYQDLIDYHLSKNNTKVLQMLNTKFIIESPNKQPRSFPGLGNAWFVEKVKLVANPQEEIEALDDDDFDPATVAVIDEGYNTVSSNSYARGQIKLKEYRANELTYTTMNQKDGLAVFSEIYYPEGWRAKIDGEEVDVKRANYILRCLEIPAGEHEVVFEFRPDSYYKGESIALAGSILLVLLLFGGVGLEIKNRLI